ncbi:MAG: DUF433 domain-containing protein [bacterium]|nr:DUF433 domain-containing protein [bacterium]
MSEKREYVEVRNGGYFVKGTRVTLDSVVYQFRDGASPEHIRDNFPALNLEQVYGAITFYLANEARINSYLADGEDKFEKLRQQSREANPELYAKLDAARERTKESSG